MNSRSEKMLLEHIRPVTEEDKEKLPMFSYSRIDQYKNCPMAYKLKYVDGKSSPDETSLALELGSLCHYVLEQKGIMLKKEGSVDYSLLKNILDNGVITQEEKMDWQPLGNGMFTPRIKPEQKMLGVQDLKKKYFEEWGQVEKNSGMDYNQKINLFWNTIVHTEMENEPWTPEYFEHYFEYVWDNKVILHGYIDRIDMMNGFYRTIDYKTSKKEYDQSKLSTSLQFGIYAMAMLLEFGQLPIESQYRFILIDKKQNALTVGWERRLVKHLQDLFNCISTDAEKGEYIPSPSPLCHWCNYCKHNPNANQYKRECDYYSLWTPTNKTHEVNRKWGEAPKRKLVF